MTFLDTGVWVGALLLHATFARRRGAKTIVTRDRACRRNH